MKNYLFSFIIVFSSCSVQIPIYRSVSTIDYNGRKNVETPAFRYKINTVGIGLTILSAGAGGYLGYKHLNLVEKYDKTTETTKPIPYANAAIGCVAGIGLATLSNYLIWKEGKVKPLTSKAELDKWLKKYDNKQLLLSDNNSYHSLTLIDKSIESKYTIKGIQDVHDFYTTFGANSLYQDNIVEQCVLTLKREELLVVNRYYPKSSKTPSLKEKYIELSTSIDECLKGYNMFPQQKNIAEQRGVELITSVYDAEKYIKKFGNNNYLSSVESSTLPTLKSIQETEKYFELFPNTSNLKQLEKQSLKTLKSISDFNLYLKLFIPTHFLEEAVLGIADNVNQADLSELISRYPSQPFTTLLKNKYILKSTSISDLVASSEKYPNHSLNIERIAYDRIFNATDADDFLEYFDKSSLTKDAESKLLEYLYFELQGLNTNLDKYKFVLKYNSLRNLRGNAFIESTYAELEKLDEKYKRKFEQFKDNIPNSNKLVLVSFETNTYPAYLAIETLEKCIQVKDYINPWITRIQYSAAYGNEGFIVGEWYKEGIDNDWWGAFGKDEVTRFINKSKKTAIANYSDLTEYNAQYFGSRESDRRGRSISSRGSNSNNCGCEISSIKDEGFIIKNGYDTVKFKNGYSVPIKYASGKWRVIGIFFDDKYDSYNEMMKKVVEDCVKSRCK